MVSVGVPVVFIHGLWLHAASWKNWLELFYDAGYEPLAPPWPGIPPTVEETRAHPEGMIGDGVAEVADHYAAIIRRLPARPIVIGHSFGGLIALHLLGRGLASSAIAIDAAPVRGLFRASLSSLRASFPVLRNPANRRRAVALSPGAFRWSFANAVSETESTELYRRWVIPAPGRPLWEAALANLAPRSPTSVDLGDPDRAPLLLMAGEKDRVVPPAVTRAMLRRFRRAPALTEIKEMPGRGHSLIIDSGWREVAIMALGWLQSHPRSVTVDSLPD